MLLLFVYFFNVKMLYLLYSIYFFLRDFVFKSPFGGFRGLFSFDDAKKFSPVTTFLPVFDSNSLPSMPSFVAESTFRFVPVFANSHVPGLNFGPGPAIPAFVRNPLLPTIA